MFVPTRSHEFEPHLLRSALVIAQLVERQFIKQWLSV
nr:MAG TPA: hypothetical protein [Caudoviricetes sp.]